MRWARSARTAPHRPVGGRVYTIAAGVQFLAPPSEFIENKLQLSASATLALPGTVPPANPCSANRLARASGSTAARNAAVCGSIGGNWAPWCETMSCRTEHRRTSRRRAVTSPCPKCDKLMDRREYAHDSGVFLQRCNDCQGHWIEGWQVPKLADYVAGNPAINRLSAKWGNTNNH